MPPGNNDRDERTLFIRIPDGKGKKRSGQHALKYDKVVLQGPDGELHIPRRSRRHESPGRVVRYPTPSSSSSSSSSGTPGTTDNHHHNGNNHHRGPPPPGRFVPPNSHRCCCHHQHRDGPPLPYDMSGTDNEHHRSYRVAHTPVAVSGALLDVGGGTHPSMYDTAFYDRGGYNADRSSYGNGNGNADDDGASLYHDVPSSPVGRPSTDAPGASGSTAANPPVVDSSPRRPPTVRNVSRPTTTGASPVTNASSTARSVSRPTTTTTGGAASPGIIGSSPRPSTARSVSRLTTAAASPLIIDSSAGCSGAGRRATAPPHVKSSSSRFTAARGASCPPHIGSASPSSMTPRGASPLTPAAVTPLVSGSSSRRPSTTRSPSHLTTAAAAAAVPSPSIHSSPRCPSGARTSSRSTTAATLGVHPASIRSSSPRSPTARSANRSTTAASANAAASPIISSSSQCPSTRRSESRSATPAFPLPVIASSSSRYSVPFSPGPPSTVRGRTTAGHLPPIIYSSSRRPSVVRSAAHSTVPVPPPIIDNSSSCYSVPFSPGASSTARGPTTAAAPPFNNGRVLPGGPSERRTQRYGGPYGERERKAEHQKGKELRGWVPWVCGVPQGTTVVDKASWFGERKKKSEGSSKIQDTSKSKNANKSKDSKKSKDASKSKDDKEKKKISIWHLESECYSSSSDRAEEVKEKKRKKKEAKRNSNCFDD